MVKNGGMPPYLPSPHSPIPVSSSVAGYFVGSPSSCLLLFVNLRAHERYMSSVMLFEATIDAFLTGRLGPCPC